MAKIITVFGATGGQGGGVVSALLKAISRGEPYAIRAVTRKPDGEKAKQLKIQGCEVVVCDMDNKGSVEQAMKGSYGVFLVTNYWEHFSMEKEVEQGKRVIDVCEALGVKHLIYSGLENVKKAIGIECAHFDGKGMVEEYLHTKNLKERLPFTIVRFPFYYNNLVSLFTPRKKDDGTLLYDIPMEGVAMDGIDVTQGGECVYGILESPDCYRFKTIGLSGDKITIQQYCETLTKHLKDKGLKFEDSKITLDEYRAQPDNPAAIELGNMFEFYKRGNPDRDIRLTKKLNEETQRFDVWVGENKAMLEEAFSKKQ